MQAILHVNPDFAPYIAGRTVQVRFSWLDSEGGSFLFTVSAPANAEQSAAALVTAFNSLPVAQRTRDGQIVTLQASGHVLAFVGHVLNGAAPLAVLGERVTAQSTTNIFSYDFVIPGGIVPMGALVTALTALGGLIHTV